MLIDPRHRRCLQHDAQGYVLASRRTSAIAGHVCGDEIRRRYPWLSADIQSVMHVRRGGDFSGQQLGAWMLEQTQERGGTLLCGAVTAIDRDHRLKLGWAYNQKSSEPQDDLANETASDPQFPEIVMRGAVRIRQHVGLLGRKAVCGLGERQRSARLCNCPLRRPIQG